MVSVGQYVQRSLHMKKVLLSQYFVELSLASYMYS